jgi:hypothetical protein
VKILVGIHPLLKVKCATESNISSWTVTLAEWQAYAKWQSIKSLKWQTLFNGSRSIRAAQTPKKILTHHECRNVAARTLKNEKLGKNTPAMWRFFLFSSFRIDLSAICFWYCATCRYAYRYVTDLHPHYAYNCRISV